MSPRRTLATTARVLRQLARDHRTLGLVLLVPPLLIVLLRYVFDAQPRVFDSVALMMLGIFPLIMMFLVTSIATLRERTSGTLDRLMAGPISKLDFIFGYAIAFSIVGLVQASLACFVTLGLLGVSVAGSATAVIVTAICASFLGTSLGLFVSAFARNEFQAVQLVMPIIMPQVLVCGLFIARAQMASVLQTISDYFPITYSVDAMRQVLTHDTWTSDLTHDLLIVLGCGVLALLLSALTIRRQE